MKKILIIPHHPFLDTLKIRLIEIAKALSSGNHVFVLNWKSTARRHSITDRIFNSIKDLLKKKRQYTADQLNVIEIPCLHRPLWLTRKINYFFLNRLIAEEKFDVVINGSFHFFPVKKNANFKYIYDIADLPLSGDNGSANHFIEAKTKEEALKADAVTAISHGMVNYVQTHYRRKAYFVPNGANLKKMNACDPEEVQKIREKYGLKDKWVIGYIGYIGSWVNVELVVQSFDLIKKKIPEAMLIWIGKTPIQNLKEKYKSERIIFTGGVEGSIEPYFHLLDVGLMCHRKCKFQDMAFHLKVIEYTAARKIIISSKLNETERLSFPNIIFSAEDSRSWQNAIFAARNKKWRPDWDRIVTDYDWENIAQKLEHVVEVA